MNSLGSTSLPFESALLSGIPPHLLDDEALSVSLRHMGLSPDPAFDIDYGGVTAREWPIGYADCPMRVIRLQPSGVMIDRLTGRYPGSEGRDFAPPEGRVLMLSWRDEALGMPDGELETILTTLALLSAFLFPQLILWQPARLWSRAPDFMRGIEKHLNGSPYPVLNMVAFDRTGKGRDARIATRGLAIFTGQELSADASGLGAAETVRRLARLVLDMFDSGPALRGATIGGLASGERITLTPQRTDGHGPDIVDIVIGNNGVRSGGGVVTA